MPDIKETSIAQAPFNNPDGDIILRSTNGVDFHVFKLILSLVSPVFKDVFTLSQELQSDKSSALLIPVEESSTTLQSLLLLCYPAVAATPTFNSLDDAKAVMEAAKKYDMGEVLNRAGNLVMAQFLQTESLELYALSCRFGWKDHAQTAAARTLEIKNLGRPSNGFASMRSITALDYHRLLVYHCSCGAAAKAVGESLDWLGPSSNNMQMWKCSKNSCRGTAVGVLIQIAAVGRLRITSWFEEYLISSGKELDSRPCESTIWESTSYNRAIVKAQGCSDCATTVIESMDLFRTLYIRQVKKALAMVSSDTHCRFENRSSPYYFCR
jgi:hypothetical protein